LNPFSHLLGWNACPWNDLKSPDMSLPILDAPERTSEDPRPLFYITIRKDAIIVARRESKYQSLSAMGYPSLLSGVEKG